ncbi:flagellar brake protein [Jeongeupia naejangsanensis]|uniref:Flagellar brake protein n=1 Tax=Jeongeupia naejangsanensis TaxID=613195 RepID=A0ABS2BGF5_9NEIS|nr:flagellar brake protein [Jeongeupia naejangsanensis]MBM3114692.1 flagellar brake protein [Jeongeupia naejangsanensis]
MISTLLEEGECLAPYRLHERARIAGILKQLALTAVPVTVHFDEGRQRVLCRVIRIDPVSGIFSFNTTQAETPTGPCCFVTSLEGAKIQFVVPDLMQPAAGEPWIAAFPLELIRVQRREFARLDAPLGRQYAASFVLDGQTYEANLYDLSQGGVGLRTTPQCAAPLIIGSVVPQVRMELGRDGALVVDLEIRMRRTFYSNLLGEQVHYGCRMVNVSTAASVKLKQLLASLENERQLFQR